MALMKKRPTDIPKDAIVLSETEAIEYQIKVLDNWEKESDVWAYKYGSHILSTVSAMVGAFINNHYRTKFRLFHYGRISSYLPICGIPAFCSFFFHNQFVLPGVILQKDCPLCLQLRASAFQSFSGCVLPAVLAPLSTFSLAVRYGTYQLPDVLKEPLKTLQVWRKATLPVGNVLFAIFVGQALLACSMTYFESNNILNVHQKLLKLEESVDNAGVTTML